MPNKPTEEEIRKAVEDSVVAWEFKLDKLHNHEYSAITLSADACPLCTLFLLPVRSTEPKKSCMGCPVRQHTGRRFCATSPFDQAQEAFVAVLLEINKKDAVGRDQHDEAVDAFENQIAFLRQFL